MNSCRHFLGLLPNSGKSCAKGRDVRAWAVRCNGGSGHGISLHLPCAKPTDKPLFNCPELDRKTADDMAREESAFIAEMEAFSKAMPAINAIRRKMIANNLDRAKATCPWCSGKDALKATVALNVNNHLHAKCVQCGKGFME